MLSGLLYQGTIPDSTPRDGRVQDGRGGGLTQGHAEEGDTGEGGWKECDIDEGDGTGGHAYAKDRESLDLNVETVTHSASGDSRDGRAGTRRGTAGTGGPHARATTTLRGGSGRRG